MAAKTNQWTRRDWLRLALAATAYGGAGARARAAARRPWGVQLYTVRDQLTGDQAKATLAAIAGIGYKEIELGRADLARLVPLARDVGLMPASTHIEAPLVTGNWEAWAPLTGGVPPSERSLDKAFEAASTHGIKYAVVSYLMPGERGTTGAAYERFADQMNRAGEVARKAGVTLGYHNHGFEFASLAEGRTPFDILATRFERALVQFELDVFWVSITGADPVDLLSRHKGRVALIHLKDKARGAARETDERKVAKATFMEVGRGDLDFEGILKAAEAAGVAHYFVEQDETPGDPVASLRQSYQHLQSLASGR